MSATSEIILSAQTHPGESTTLSVTGEKFKGDGFYSRADGFHTVQYNLNGFIGVVSMQASLASDPGAADWFTVTNSSITSASDDSDYNTGSFLVNFVGNFVWVRAIVRNWTDGSVTSVLLNH
jgi:hypothetical protein